MKKTNFLTAIAVALLSAGLAYGQTNVTTTGGTTNYIPKFTGSTTIANSSIFDNGNVGIGTTSPSAKLHVTGGALLFSGTTGSTPASGTGTRMMWIPDKGAFRAGYVEFANWDSDSVGTNSFAAGLNSKAVGEYSVALGASNVARGYSSTAFGDGTIASGEFSTAFGVGTIASSSISTAFGESTTASGEVSTAFGVGTIASANISTAFGAGTTASAHGATAFGENTTASGYVSIALGSGIEVSGDYSVGIGLDGEYYNVEDQSVFSIMGGPVGIGTVSPGYMLDVEGDIYCSGSYEGSDKRYKKNITTVTGALDKIKSLRGATYAFRTEEFKSKNFSEGNQYGFIAQELKEVMPELVKQDKEGFYAVNYTGVIPVLVEAMKEQQSVIEEQNSINQQQQLLIEELSSKIETLEKTMGIGNDLDNTNARTGLYQNNPNPFSRQTEINFYLADDVSNATIMIFDMSGKQMKRYELTSRGNDKVVIHGNELAPGMYMYSLIADGKLVDTKRMILTE